MVDTCTGAKEGWYDSHIGTRCTITRCTWKIVGLFTPLMCWVSQSSPGHPPPPPPPPPPHTTISCLLFISVHISCLHPSISSAGCPYTCPSSIPFFLHLASAFQPPKWELWHFVNIHLCTSVTFSFWYPYPITLIPVIPNAPGRFFRCLGNPDEYLTISGTTFDAAHRLVSNCVLQRSVREVSQPYEYDYD